MSNPYDEASKKFVAGTMGGVSKAFKAVWPMLAIPAAGALVNYYMGKKDNADDAHALQNSLNTLMNDKNLSKNPEAAIARFRELSYVAPSIAKNPSMAARFITQRLDSGLSVDDIHKLSVIQASGVVGKQSPTASSRAMMAAGDLASKVLNFAGYSGYKDMNREISQGVDAIRSAKAQFADDITRARQTEENMKKQSSVAQKVSDECLGEMLADRYLIMREDLTKEAGVNMDALKKGVSYFAPALVMGGAIHGAGLLVDALNKRKLTSAADSAYEKVKKNSELIKGNPGLAEEALDAIKTFAPEVATKPAVLKSFIEHTITMGMIAPQTIKDLAETQGHVTRSKAPGFASGFISGAMPVVSIGNQMMPSDKQQEYSRKQDAIKGKGTP